MPGREKVYEQSFFVAGSGLIWPFCDLRAEDVPGKKRLAAFQEIRGEIQFKIRPADGVAATGPEASSSIFLTPTNKVCGPTPGARFESSVDTSSQQGYLAERRCPLGMPSPGRSPWSPLAQRLSLTTPGTGAAPRDTLGTSSSSIEITRS